MINKVVFFCSWHHGDWHLAKEYVRNFFKQFDAAGVECVAVTSRDPHIVNISGLKSENMESWPHLQSNPPTYWDAKSGTYYINIWVGYYGLAGGSGGNHNFANQIEMWKVIAERLKADTGFELTCIEDPNQSVPNIDDDILGDYELPPKKSVYFANSIAWSGQTTINTMPGAIASLANEFPDITFICTENIGLNINNVLYTDDMTHRSTCGYNPLPETAKISEGCSIVVTNCSGPGTFAMTRNNFNNENQSMIVLLTNEGLSPHNGVFHKSQIIFSPTSDEWEVGRIVRQIIIDRGLNA